MVLFKCWRCCIKVHDVCSCCQVIWMIWFSMVFVLCVKLYLLNRIWPQRFDISSPAVLAFISPAAYTLSFSRMCPSGSWERKWSSPFMMMLMWPVSLRVWRRDHRDGWDVSNSDLTVNVSGSMVTAHDDVCWSQVAQPADEAAPAVPDEPMEHWEIPVS